MVKVKFFSKVGQKSRSMSQGKKFWFQQEGIATRNTHVKYESPIWFGSKVVDKVKFISKGGQKSRSRSRGKKFWFKQQGIATRNTHVKYESPISFGSKLVAKVKFFSKVGQVKVKVTKSKILVLIERSCHKE